MIETPKLNALQCIKDILVVCIYKIQLFEGTHVKLFTMWGTDDQEMKTYQFFLQHWQRLYHFQSQELDYPEKTKTTKHSKTSEHMTVHSTPHPFPHTKIKQLMTENIRSKTCIPVISIYKWKKHILYWIKLWRRMSNFSFFHNSFISCLLLNLMHQKVSAYGKGLSLECIFGKR